MKKLFLLSILSFCLFSVNFAVAQVSSSTENQSFVVATVNIYDAKIVSVEGRNHQISFELSNESGVQSQVRYSVQLTKETSSGDIVVDEYVYDSSFSINENTVIPQIINYLIPNSVSSGQYKMWIFSKNNNGLTLAAAYVGEIFLSPTDEGVMEIIPESCLLNIKGSDEKYSINNLLNISKEDALIINCKVLSTFDKNISVSPKFETRLKSVYGNLVEQVGGSNSTISIKKGENNIKVELSKANQPQSYVNIFSLVSEDNKIYTNKIISTYYINGESGSIMNVVFDKTFYKKGDTANIQIFSDTEQSQSTSSSSSAFISILMKDGDGKDCSEVIISEIDKKIPVTDISIPIITKCINPQSEISLSVKGVNGEYMILDTVSYNIQTPKEDLPTSYLFIALILIVVFLLMIILIKKRRTSLIKSLAFSIIGLGSLFGISNKAEALTTVHGYTGGGQMTFTYNLNKSEYSPGESIVVTGIISGGSSSFHDTSNVPDHSLSIKDVRIDNSGDKRHLVSNNVQGTFDLCNRNYRNLASSVSGAQTFQSPVTPGDYNMNATYHNYYKYYDTFCFLGTKSVLGNHQVNTDIAYKSLPFTVKAVFPIGAIDNKAPTGMTDSCYVGGWACDPNSPTSNLPVKVGYLSSPINTPSWSYCASEGGSCNLGTKGSIMYGVDTRWYYKYNVTGTISCNNATFGDPAVGVPKSCRVLNSPWTYCAGEGGVCNVGTNSDIAYGADSRWVYQYNIDSSVSCGLSSFGVDPAPGVLKKCFSSPTNFNLIEDTALLDMIYDETIIANACDGETKRFYVPIGSSFTELWDGLDHTFVAIVLGVNESGIIENPPMYSTFTSTIACKAPVSLDINANPLTVISGASSMISWNSTSADSCDLTKNGIEMFSHTPSSDCVAAGGTWDSAANACYMPLAETACIDIGGTFNSCYTPHCPPAYVCSQVCRQRCTVPAANVPEYGYTSGSISSGPLTSNTTFAISCENDTSSASNSVVVSVYEALTPSLNISASGEEGIVWNTEGFETGFCEVKLDDETLSTLLSGSIYDVMVGEKYILECTTSEGDIMSDEVIAVPVTSKTVCTPSQNFVNRPTVWTVSNGSGEVIETTWGGTNISTTTKSGGSLTKIYTTIGEKTINAISTIRRDDETTFTSTCSTSTFIKLDSGSNTEI